MWSLLEWSVLARCSARVVTFEERRNRMSLIVTFRAGRTLFAFFFASERMVGFEKMRWKALGT